MNDSKSKTNDGGGTEAAADTPALNLQFEKLDLNGMKESSKIALLASSDFYYNLQLPVIEKTAEELKSKLLACDKTPRTRKDKKMEKAIKQKEKLLQARGNFEKLTITFPNDQYQKPQQEVLDQQLPGTSQKLNKKKKDKIDKNPIQDTNSLLQRLKMLRDGKISGENVKKSVLASAKKTEVTTKKDEEINKNRQEVLRLNREIQMRIAQQIKPKLKIIMNPGTNEIEQLNGFNKKKTISESSQKIEINQKKSKVRRPMKSTREIPILRTKLTLPTADITEIYRYNFDDLYQLQDKATLEMVPTLIKMNLCGSTFNQLDTFLFLLLSMKTDDERLIAIMDAAEGRQIIRRLGPNEFKFSTVSTFESAIHEPPKVELEKTPKKIQNDEQKKDKFEHFKLVVKNDEELNQLIYQHEFVNLFESSLKNHDLKGKNVDEMVKHLIESNQARIIDGEVRVNSKNLQEAYVSNPTGKQDICISKLILRKHAFHGDLVRVLVSENAEDMNISIPIDVGTDDDLDVTMQSESIPTSRSFGCVLEVLEKRHGRRVIGSLAPIDNIKKKRKHLMFVTRDPKVPSIRVNSSDGIPKDVELSDQLLMVVEITSWSHDQPQGKIVEIIGKKGQLKTENSAILLQHNLDPQPYSQEIIDQLPTEPFQIPEKEFEYRQDLRKKCIFSIDPETARDLDDALSCEVLPNGNLEIGVHISDVTYFLHENSELDMLVKEKATSIYLVDTVYHMLPVPLCLLCSLLPGSDKMAYTVFWEMNPDTAEIIDTRFTRSVVKSCAKLNYDHAQMVIEKNDTNWKDLEEDFPVIHNGFTVNDVANVIVKLQKIAVILRDLRKANGALKIDQPKVSFKFEKNDQRMEAPIDYFKYPIKDSNKLIEEFMLLANISVAKFIYDKFPEISLLRSHYPPKENGIKKLVETLQKFGIEMDASSSSVISDSMETIVKHAKAPAAMNAAINLMTSKTMTRARYYCSDIAKEPADFWHYALSIPMYTHFTSPIRRYADILVHRVLNAALGYEAQPSRSPEEVQQLATICNVQKQQAKLAGDDSSNLYFMYFIKSLKSKTMPVAVMGIYDYNLEVVLIETGHVVKIYYRNLEQNDAVIVKPFTDNMPPYVSVIMPKLDLASMKIEFGSELMAQVEVIHEKLVINRIFYNTK